MYFGFDRGHSSATGYFRHHGWLAPSSGCWGDPVGPKGCSQIALHLLSATNGAHQAKMAVCAHQVAKNWVCHVLFLRLLWEWFLQPSDIISNISCLSMSPSATLVGAAGECGPGSICSWPPCGGTCLCPPTLKIPPH